MRGSEVKIGQSYLARVSGVLCRVEVVRELFARRGTRWAVMNTRTGRMIEVSAARLTPMIAVTVPSSRQCIACKSPATIDTGETMYHRPVWACAECAPAFMDTVATVARPDYQPIGPDDTF